MTTRAPLTALMAVALAALLALPVAAAVAQDQQMSPEEVQQLMNAINEKMRGLEQMLAKASLEPQELETIIAQLRNAVETDTVDRLPATLREFLLNNPDLLAKLKAPDATGDDLLKVEDEVRRLLATQEDGLEQLLKDNPDMLRRMLSESENVEEALRNHAQVENNLEELFGRASSQMESTEGDIQKLIELAEQMQQGY